MRKRAAGRTVGTRGGGRLRAAKTSEQRWPRHATNLTAACDGLDRRVGRARGGSPGPSGDEVNEEDQRDDPDRDSEDTDAEQRDDDRDDHECEHEGDNVRWLPRRGELWVLDRGK